jgi:hypothetical protein
LANTSPLLLKQPFIYGRPVRTDEFLDRKNEVRAILNRLRNGESTAVVGEPHIGKSSLLQHLAQPTARQANLGAEAEALILSPLDLHPVGIDYTPALFWEEVLEPVLDLVEADAELKAILARLTESKYARRPLERLFNHLGGQGKRLVLLLDEFDVLLRHANFQDASFFALLRSLATRTGGLALVTASRLSVAEMNERGHGLLDTGSPFFNNTIEVRLRPFDEATVGALLDRGGVHFSRDDRRIIRRVAGRHPFLLQAMSAALLESDGEDRHVQAAETCYGRISFHFDDLWRSLDDATRTTAVILSLVELGGRALGREFAYGEIEGVDAFGPELNRLAERGLTEQVGEGWQFDSEHLLLWRGARWTVGAQAFAWWVRDVVIAGSRQVPAYDEWLNDKRYRLLLTQEQWDGLLGVVQKAPDWAVRGVGGLARALVDELLKKK